MNRTKEYEMTILVPVFNEEDNMERLEETLASYLPKAKVRSCVLFINDGSTDSSLPKMQAICQRHDDFFYISSTTNHGLSTAMKAGIDTSESRLTAYIDADLQTTPEDFNRLLDYAADYQLVSGIRAHRQDSRFKLLQSRIANSFRRMMTGDKATDTGCPLKIMWTSYARRIPFFNGMHRFLPALIALEGGRFKELPVNHYPRKAGVSKYHLRNRLLGPLADCFAVRWMRWRHIGYSVDQSNLR